MQLEDHGVDTELSLARIGKGNVARRQGECCEVALAASELHLPRVRSLKAGPSTGVDCREPRHHCHLHTRASDTAPDLPHLVTVYCHVSVKAVQLAFICSTNLRGAVFQ
jgi:hypothetical protein